jgi:hypothetical protein
VVENQTENDLERFKALIEAEGYASGAWRGAVQDLPGTPGIEDAAASRGDSGKAGVSGKVAAAGVAAAAAAAVGVAAAAKKGSSDVDEVETVVETPDVVPPIEAAPELRGAGTMPTTGTPGTVPGAPVVDALDDDPSGGERRDRSKTGPLDV